MLKGVGVETGTDRAEAFETATSIAHRLGLWADPTYDSPQPRSPKIRQLHRV